MDKIAFFEKYNTIVRLGLGIINCFTVKKKCKGKDNVIKGLDSVIAHNTSINIVGNGNFIELGKLSQINGVSISIYGDNNIIQVGQRNYLERCSLDVEDNNGKIITGTHTYIHNRSEIAAIESTTIELGEDCLLSSEVVIRSGDSHRIESVVTGKRINQSVNISIGNHVWIGKRAIILKGAKIADGCVVGAGAIVTRNCECEHNAIVSGNPARRVKQNILWKHIRESNTDEA